MELLTIKKFADLAGVSRQNIYKRIEAGTVVADDAGMIDPTLPANADYLLKYSRPDGKKYSDLEKPEQASVQKKQEKEEHNTKQPEKKQASQGKANQEIKKVKQVSVPQKETIPVQIEPEKLPQQQELDLSNLPDDLTTLSKYDLDRLKQVIGIQKEKVKTDKERETLIDRSIVFLFVSKIYEIDNNQFLQMGASITTKICKNVFGNDDSEKFAQVDEIINDELYKVQNYKKTEMNNFLNKLKLDGVA
jgi:hypothetical protein